MPRPEPTAGRAPPLDGGGGAGGWVDLFPALRSLEGAAADALARSARALRVPAGARVFGVGERCGRALLVTSGGIRVAQTSAGGREVVLYRLRAGEACLLSTLCLLSGDPYTADATAESETSAVEVPKAAFDALMAGSAAFRACVFAAAGARLADLVALVEDVAFRAMDVRLAGRVLALADGAGEVRLTHAELAAELGTAREVVSRLLKEFERRGWVTLARGRVVLRDAPRLAALVAEKGPV